MYTGKEDITKTAIIESYKNKRYCNIVEEEKNIYIFKVYLLKFDSLGAIDK